MEWIDTEVQEPDPSLMHIIVFTTNEMIHTAHYFKDFENWVLWETDTGLIGTETGAPGDIIHFTHWMPLPKPPKEP